MDLESRTALIVDQMTSNYGQLLIRTETNNIMNVCHIASCAGGWWDDVDLTKDTYVVPTKLCLIHSEISEAMEGHRKGLMDDHLPDRLMVEVELADALIRIFDLAGALKLDIGGALAEKMKYNMSRADHKSEHRQSDGGKKY